MTARLHRLPNGVRVVTEHMPGLQSASVGIWVGAGGRHETPDQNGIAHFLEHMAFKGTSRRSALQIAEEIEDVGGYINAYTSREVTAYYARVLASDVPLAVDLIADIVLNPIFDAGEIETERNVILQEIGQALDTPDDIIFDWLQEAAYPEQPIGRTILGPTERVSAFDRADLERFTAQHYGPEQMILSAAGAVDHDALVRMAEDLFGHLEPTRPGPVEIARFTGGEARHVRDLEQAHIALGFAQPGYRDDDIYTAQIFAGAMGGGMSSRLFQEAREKRGLCYTIFASVGAYSDTGLLTVYAGTGEDDVAELAHLTMDELKRAADDMTDAEIARARAQMKSGMLMGLESPSSRAERLARVVAVWDRVPPLSEAIGRIEAVDVPAVRAHAAALTTQAPALALYGPVERAPDAGTLARRLAA
ncbi:pitrilysin family protein [uncultured Jannaschia sp.]|uniref:M16 family metallopeptidase n=1 Tax=uncultured Jannaschia sp. TaxID=293347 RepID=UPI0026250171|nr:pitrilysin family protein [uncultured Jannaschia sp.]